MTLYTATFDAETNNYVEGGSGVAPERVTDIVKSGTYSYKVTGPTDFQRFFGDGADTPSLREFDFYIVTATGAVGSGILRIYGTNYILGLNHTPGNYRLGFFDHLWNNLGYGATVFASATWYHIKLVYESGHYKGYVDDVLQFDYAVGSVDNDTFDMYGGDSQGKGTANYRLDNCYCEIGSAAAGGPCKLIAAAQVV